MMLLGLAIYLFAHNSRGLTGSSAGPHLEERIRSFAQSLNGVSQIHDLKTIDYGLSGVVVHMRVEVDPDTQVKDVDDLTERIRDRLQARIGNIKDVIIEVQADETNISWRDQFYRLVEDGREQQVLKPREEQMLKNVYDFTHVVVADIMVPRMDVDCLEVTETIDDLMDLVIKTGHTRIPVYDDDIDNMLGAIHVKEIFAYLRQGETNVPLKDLVNPFEIYPENKPVSDLLEEFKRKKIQIAMVADEHGGFAGIVTIEDLLEEIVGEIWDEFDVDTDIIEQPQPQRLILTGRFDIDELNERYGLSIPDEEFNTVGGFVFGMLGREPKEGDAIDFEDMTFTVLKMDGHRVDQVEIVSLTPFVSRQEQEESIEPVTNGNGNH
jgi:CBS domain containing-hemolysin-like protein